MKNRLFFTLLLQLIIAPAAMLAQTATFTYQGRLLDGIEPANGSYDLRFALTATPTNGNYIGTSLTNAPIRVSDGLFTVTLDFGEIVFDGSPRWLEIGVRTSGSSGPYTTLSPRQAITATPYAAFANTASNAAVAAGLVPGAAVVVNGAGITNLNGAFIQAGTVNSNAFDSGTKAQLALAGTETSGGGGLGSSILNGENVSSLLWATNVLGYSNIFYTNLTLTGCAISNANGSYYPQGTLSDPSQLPLEGGEFTRFTWTNANGYQFIFDTSYETNDCPYLLYDITTNAVYQQAGNVWIDGSLALDFYNLNHPLPAGTLTATRTTNYVAHLVLRTDNASPSLVVSNGVVAASVAANSFSGDGSLVSNTVPNGYASVLLSVNDQRTPQGAVFKQKFAAPPMGICTWPKFNAQISDAVVRGLADALYTNHLVELGWRVLQLDGGWQGGTNWGGRNSGRDTNGLLAYHTTRFPDWTNTLKYLRDRGLVLGLYHEMTKGNEGMVLKDHYAEDAAMLKAWGVEYMKIDEGAKAPDERFDQFAAFRAAALAIDWYPFVMNGGLGPTNLDLRFPLVVNAGRLGMDGDLYVGASTNTLSSGTLNHFEHAMTYLWPFGGVGYCKDMDFLYFSGVTNIAIAEAALSLWTIGPSILMLDTVSANILPVITNRAFIAVHQDPLGMPGKQVTTNADYEVWYRPLVEGAKAVCVINKSQTSQTNTIVLSSLGITPQTNVYWTVYSVWNKSVMGYVTNDFSVTVRPRYANLLTVTPNRLAATPFALPTTNTPPLGVISTLKTDGTNLYWQSD